MKKQYYRNHLIKKKWGQIFLKDEIIINSIINFFNPKKHQTIIEIGPGLGALTKPMLDILDSIILIECDSQLSNRLLKISQKKIKIINQDIMTVNFFHFLTHTQQKIRLIGNLPYNISTKLIIYLFKYIDIIDDMYFMFQKEVGKRIIAQPNNKEYGRLSIITQYYCKTIPILNISKQSFVPVPKVESMMIRFIPYHQHTPYPNINVELLSLITQVAFHKRRKIIQNSLSSLFNPKEIIQNGIDVKARAENLTIQQFCILTNILYNRI